MVVNLKRFLNAKMTTNTIGAIVIEDAKVSALKSKVFITNVNAINNKNITAILRDSDSLYVL